MTTNSRRSVLKGAAAMAGASALAVFHSGPSEPLLNDLSYRKQILWI